MSSETFLENLQIEKASVNDWKLILDLLEETELKSCLTGDENYKNFYVIKSKDYKTLICCFCIDDEGEVGILKSFAISKRLQGKGIGKSVANNTSSIAKELGIKRLYAVSWEAPDFWEKTKFKEIKKDTSKDNFFIKYTDDLEKNFPQFSKRRVHFLLTVED